MENVVATEKSDNSLLTFRGEALFPHLLRPNTKFDPDGNYECKLLIPLVNCKVVLQSASNRLKEFAKKTNKVIDNKKLPWKKQVRDGQVIEDMVEIKFKMKANITTQSKEIYSQKPVVYDASRNAWDNSVSIYSGSELVVAASTYLWDVGNSCGITFQPKFVQVVKLVSAPQMNFDKIGFINEPVEVVLEPSENNIVAEGDVGKDTDLNF